MMQELLLSHIQPNVVSYNAAISACEKGKKWELALHWLQELWRSSLEPDVVSYNAAISAHGKGRQ